MDGLSGKRWDEADERHWALAKPSCPQLFEPRRAVLGLEWSFIKFLTWSFIKFFIFIQTWAQLYSTLRAWEDFPTELLILIPIWAQPELFQCSEWDVEVDDFHLFYLLFKFQFSLPHHLASSLGQCSALRDNFIELLILIFMPVLFVRAIMPNSIFSNAQLRMKWKIWPRLSYHPELVEMLNLMILLNFALIIFYFHYFSIAFLDYLIHFISGLAPYVDMHTRTTLTLRFFFKHLIWFFFGFLYFIFPIF